MAPVTLSLSPLPPPPPPPLQSLLFSILDTPPPRPPPSPHSPPHLPLPTTVLYVQHSLLGLLSSREHDVFILDESPTSTLFPSPSLLASSKSPVYPDTIFLRLCHGRSSSSTSSSSSSISFYRLCSFLQGKHQNREKLMILF